MGAGVLPADGGGGGEGAEEVLVSNYCCSYWARAHNDDGGLAYADASGDAWLCVLPEPLRLSPPPEGDSLDVKAG